MNELEEQILESWRAHNRIMLYVIDNIPEEAMNATLSKRAGRGIAGQLAHVHMIRFWHLEARSVKFVKGLMKLTKDDTLDKEILLKAFKQSGEYIERYLQGKLEDMEPAKSFKRKVVPTLCYFIGHETHHRGNIFLTIKQAGHKLPEALKWGIWDWNHFQDNVSRIKDEENQE